MSLPRPILPGASYMVTRRITQRQFQLLPSAIINQIVLYCVALAARDTGVQVHAVCALSNHIHLVVTDPSAKLPRFSYIAFKYIAKCVNAHRGRRENLWAGGVQPSYVRLEDPPAVLDKIAYTAANPVEAALVKLAKHWPGLNLWQAGEYKAQRPKVFFSEGDSSDEDAASHEDTRCNENAASGEDGAERKLEPTPESIKLELAPAPIGEHLNRREIMEQVGQAVAAREAMLRKKHREAGRTYLGVERVRTQKPTDNPDTPEPRRRKKISPRIATRDKWRRIESLQKLDTFCADYRVAWLAWRGGDREVVFPAGVYNMRVNHGVRCAETRCAET